MVLFVGLDQKSPRYLGGIEKKCLRYETFSLTKEETIIIQRQTTKDTRALHETTTEITHTASISKGSE